MIKDDVMDHLNIRLPSGGTLHFPTTDHINDV